MAKGGDWGHGQNRTHRGAAESAEENAEKKDKTEIAEEAENAEQAGQAQAGIRACMRRAASAYCLGQAFGGRAHGSRKIGPDWPDM